MRRKARDTAVDLVTKPFSMIGFQSKWYGSGSRSGHGSGRDDGEDDGDDGESAGLNWPYQRA